MARNRLVEKEGAGRVFGAGWRVKLAGLAFVLSLVAVVAVALTMFAGGFTSSEAIYVEAPRAGLVMDKDAKVKMRGVDIGTVKSITDTGQQIQGSPVMEVVLSVQVPGQEPYDVTHKQVIALQAMGNWQPGAIFPVRVDPNEPRSVIIG